MGTLYLTRVQPNPPGKDVSSRGYATAAQLNAEWVEFALVGNDRALIQDQLFHNTFTSSGCIVTGTDELITFVSGSLVAGQGVRVHTGSGATWQEGQLYHVYLNRSWFVWNNACGDRAFLSYKGTVLDWASYAPNPREGILLRVQGTNYFA